MSVHVAAEPALARLDAATDFLPDPKVSVKIHLFKEAVDSSRLEGAAVSLAEVLEHEARAVRAGTRPVTDAMGCASALARLRAFSRQRSSPRVC
jgi:hypothetical protein